MRTIPIKMRNEMSEDPFYKQCAVAHFGNCEKKIEWHHVWIYGGRQINEKWAILPTCNYHHDMVKKSKIIKDEFEYISLMRATKEDLDKYPKKPWKQIKNYLSIKLS